MAIRKPRLVIIAPEHPEIWEETAAKELKHYLKRTALSVTAYQKPATFYVGNTERARAAGVLTEDLVDESWLIRALPDGSVIICGGGTRGTLYGVCHFLEEQIGIRWFSPTEEFIPKARHCDFTGLSITGRPYFRLRNIFRMPKPAADRGRFAMHLRINQDGEWPLIAPQYGLSVDFGSPKHCHSIENGYLPGKKYFKSNPEYYALIDGKRNPDIWFGQICLSAPNMVKILTAKLKSYIQYDEERYCRQGRVPPKIYDISLNDSRAFCQCPECTAKVARYGESGTLLLILNQIAAELEKFRPGYWLQTLGYFATSEPPCGDIKPLGNILIRTCNTGTFLHENLQASANCQYRDQVEKWAACSNMIFPWEYAITYGSAGPLPYPSEFTLGDNLRFYASNKSIGVFFEHENPDLNDMYDLKVYLEAKLLENPTLDVEGVIKDFCEKYYGKAASFVMEYRQKLRQTAFQNHAKVCFFFPAPEDFRYIDWTAMKSFQVILSQGALAVKHNPVLKHRLNRACGSLDFALAGSLSWFYRWQAGKSGESELFEQMRSISRRRLFATWQKSVNHLKLHEKRNISDKNLAFMKFWKKRSSISIKPYSPPFATKYEFFPPDCWGGPAHKAIPIQTGKAAAGFCFRIPLPDNVERIRIAVSEYEVASQSEKSLESTEYQLSTFPRKTFAWFPLGKFHLDRKNMLLSVIDRHHLNWGLDFLRDLYPNRELLFQVELRLNSGKHFSLDIGSVVVFIGSDGNYE